MGRDGKGKSSRPHIWSDHPWLLPPNQCVPTPSRWYKRVVLVLCSLCLSDRDCYLEVILQYLLRVRQRRAFQCHERIKLFQLLLLIKSPSWRSPGERERYTHTGPGYFNVLAYLLSIGGLQRVACICKDHPGG